MLTGWRQLLLHGQVHSITVTALAHRQLLHAAAFATWHTASCSIPVEKEWRFARRFLLNVPLANASCSKLNNLDTQ
jgi:hypothetical protein